MNMNQVLPEDVSVGDVVQSNSSPSMWLEVRGEPTAQMQVSDGEDRVVYELVGVLVEPEEQKGVEHSFRYLSTVKVNRRRVG